MGSSSGKIFSSVRTPESLRASVLQAEQKAADVSFSTKVAEVLGSLLVEVNGRDVDLVNERLKELKTALAESLEGSFDQVFGGSVAKHTYVDGLSDIDSLVLIEDSEIDGATPDVALSKMTGALKGAVGDGASVSHGSMAVTVGYSDGMIIQLLPAFRSDEGLYKVPSSRGAGWSQIDPVAFQAALTNRNRECGGKLVPTIKLAKAINGLLPESQRLSGYHLESLGISAFKQYSGEKTTAAMLPHFFERARELVLTPIRDRTGQSVHVDDYLGGASSDARKAASHVLGRLARRMRNATSAESVEQWRALFGVDQ